MQLEPETGTGSGTERRVAVGVRAAQVVVDVAGGDGGPELGRAGREQPEQRDRVGPPGEGDEEVLAEEFGKLRAERGDETRDEHELGADEWNRTTDTGLMRPLLYR